MIVLDILLDGLFAAIAGIGFGAISDPPMRAFPYIALLAAVGHACRFCLMTFFGVDIATASLFGALVIGFGSLWLGRQDLLPDDSALYPGFIADDPQGKFAYNMVFSLIMFLQTMDEPVQKAKYIEMFMVDGFVTFTAIFMLTGRCDTADLPPAG